MLMFIMFCLSLLLLFGWSSFWPEKTALLFAVTFYDGVMMECVEFGLRSSYCSSSLQLFSLTVICKYPLQSPIMDQLLRDELVFEVGIRGYTARAKDAKADLLRHFDRLVRRRRRGKLLRTSLYR